MPHRVLVLCRRSNAHEASPYLKRPMCDDLPTTSVVSFNFRNDLDTLAGLAEDRSDVVDVVRTANERREHDVNLRTHCYVSRATAIVV